MQDETRELLKGLQVEANLEATDMQNAGDRAGAAIFQRFSNMLNRYIERQDAKQEQISAADALQPDPNLEG